MKRFVKWVGGITGLVAVGAIGWLVVAPPELLRIGNGYAAKIVCSNVFVAGRDADDVLAVDVLAPGNPLLRLVSVTVDRAKGTVTAGMPLVGDLGFAIYRPGLGCSTVPDGNFAGVPALSVVPAAVASGDLWPEGEATEIDPAVQAVAENPDLAGPGLRALVVIRDGRIIAETYGTGFSAGTPLLGWSMTKTVSAAIVGIRIAQGAMSLDTRRLRPEWAGDGRAAISLADLMAMQTGLEFNESYGSVSDATRMLFLESDMAGFVAAKPSGDTPGTVFNYSSGTTTLMSRLWMDTLPSQGEALDFPSKALFQPLGMASAVMEPDARGTFVGSSYMYATARDWARFARFLLDDGVVDGERLLPEGFVDFMRTPSRASRGAYGSGQVWLGRNRGQTVASLPQDTFWMRGHDGQTTMVVPSLDLAFVRLGLTPSRGSYDASDLGTAIVEALK